MACLSVIYNNTTATEISCENKVVVEWMTYDVGVVKVCEMLSATTISSSDTIEADATIDALDFVGNKNISVLPVDVAISFPALKLYAAFDCSINTIGKINFKGLGKLKHLYLHQNQIEAIASDTFEDLFSLETLFLSKTEFSNFL